MDKMKKIVTIVVLCMATCTLWAQNEVNLVVSGEGKNKEEATFKALRSAIEQAYGTFVSANTTVLNDKLVADEIVSLSSGNIKKYEYVSENKMPDGNTFVTLSATVSIDKLVSFAESKGMEAELKGGLFAMNIKKMEFDKQAEEKAENKKALPLIVVSVFGTGALFCFVFYLIKYIQSFNYYEEKDELGNIIARGYDFDPDSMVIFILALFLIVLAIFSYIKIFKGKFSMLFYANVTLFTVSMSLIYGIARLIRMYVKGKDPTTYWIWFGVGLATVLAFLGLSLFLYFRNKKNISESNQQA